MTCALARTMLSAEMRWCKVVRALSPKTRSYFAPVADRQLAAEPTLYHLPGQYASVVARLAMLELGRVRSRQVDYLPAALSQEEVRLQRQQLQLVGLA